MAPVLTDPTLTGTPPGAAFAAGAAAVWPSGSDARYFQYRPAPPNTASAANAIGRRFMKSGNGASKRTPEGSFPRGFLRRQAAFVLRRLPGGETGRFYAPSAAVAASRLLLRLLLR